MTICIAGKNSIAIEIAKTVKANFPSLQLVAIANQNDQGINDWQPSFKWFCKKNNIPLVDLDSVNDIDNLVFISLEFDKIIKPDKFQSKKLYNIHFSALPAYKGMFTSLMPILNGETKTGVTLHVIDSGIDTGNIIAQEIFNINLNDTAEDLYYKYLSHGIALVKANLSVLIHKNVAQSQPQSHLNSTYFSKHKINFNHIQIDFKKSAWEVHNQVRAFSFRPYQLPIVANTPVYRSEIILNKSIGNQLGKIIEENEWYFIINAIDYQVKVFKDKSEELYEIAKTGNLKEFDRLKLNGFPTNIRLKNGWNALIIACYHNQLEFAKTLVESGWDINCKNYKGTTCLMYAMTASSRDNDKRLLSFLLTKNPDLIAKDDQGKNIFEYAIEYQNKSVIDLLNSFK